MSRGSVEQSLEAVEQALSHLATSLDRGGFASGAPTYQQMADVVLGQYGWVDANGIDDLDDRFRNIAALASRIHAALEPYVNVMGRLAVLSGLVPEPDSSISARILHVLRKNGRAMSFTAIGQAIGEPASVVKKELIELVSSTRVLPTGSAGRPKYRLRPDD
jgi:hypothetical protein